MKSDAEVEKEEIGSISAEYESNNNPKAVGYDNGGGYSYGKYQIETKYGTMSDYIKYLKTKPEYREYANILSNAGGYGLTYRKNGDCNSLLKRKIK